METSKAEEKSRNASLILPWKTKLMVTFASLCTDALRRSNGKILNRRLVRVFDARSTADPTPVGGVCSRDIVLDRSRDLWIRLYLPSTTAAATLPVIIFFHGGGFSFLSAASRDYHAFCRRIARRTLALVVSVNYRLAPEHRFPAQYDDGVEVLRFLGRTTYLARGDLSRCFLAGDSAGANIAHHVARRWSIEGGDPKITILGLISIQTFFGGEERVASELCLSNVPLVNLNRTDWMWKAFLPKGEDRDHEACNVFGPRSKVQLGEGFPAKVMVVVGGFDPLQDWQRRYAEGLRERGREVALVEYPSAIHAFYLFPELPEVELLLAEVRSFVDGCCSPKVVAADVGQQQRT